jgi:hypothetical protein
LVILCLFPFCRENVAGLLETAVSGAVLIGARFSRCSQALFGPFSRLLRRLAASVALNTLSSLCLRKMPCGSFFRPRTKKCHPQLADST